jgi:hypothetical protein
MTTLALSIQAEKTMPAQVYCPICTHTVPAEVIELSGGLRRHPKMVVAPGQKCSRCWTSLDAASIVRIEDSRGPAESERASRIAA